MVTLFGGVFPTGKKDGIDHWNSIMVFNFENISLMQDHSLPMWHIVAN